MPERTNEPNAETRAYYRALIYGDLPAARAVKDAQFQKRLSDYKTTLEHFEQHQNRMSPEEQALYQELMGEQLRGLEILRGNINWLEEDIQKRVMEAKNAQSSS